MRVPRLALRALDRSVALNIGLAVLTVAGAVWAYLLVTTDPNAASAAATSSTQRLVTVSQGDVNATVSATGAVQSASTASADFATSGTVSAILVHVGDTVSSGQVLAKVEPSSVQAQLDTANANLSAAQASLTRAQVGGDNATIATAQAQVTNARAAVGSARRALDGTALKAPMAGTVTAINGSVGGSSGGGGSGGSGGSSGTGSAGSSPFIALADLTHMQISASFAEADATKLKVGQAATVTWAALTGASATGEVAAIAPTASTSNSVNSYAVVTTLDTLPQGIRLGQTVTVQVTTAAANNVVRIPVAAVRGTVNRRMVAVMVNGVATPRTVQVGVEGDTYDEIVSGVNVGDQVVIVIAASGTQNSLTGRGGLGGFGGFGGGLGGGGGGGGRAGG